MNAVSAWIIRHRFIVICLIAAVSALMVYNLRGLRVNPDIIAYLPKTDPVVELFDRIGDEYRGNALALVALHADDVITSDVLTVVNNLTRRLRTVEGVSTVTSLTNVIDIRDADGQIEIGRLVDEHAIPSDPGALTALKTYILSRDRYCGRLLSEDGAHTLIVCRLRSGAGEVETVRRIRQAAAEIAPNAELYFGGSPVILEQINSVILDDLLLLVPLVSLLVVLSLYFSFRSLRGVALPIVSVALSTLWTLGTMAWMGVALSIISDIIPVILIAIGSAYGIHLVNVFDATVTVEGSKHADAGRALSVIAIPVLLAAVTTIVGFVSFIFGSYLTMIREFGVFTALGVFFSLIVSVTLIPAVVVALPVRRRGDNAAAPPRGRAFDRGMDLMAVKILKHPRTVLGLGVLIVVSGAFGISSVERRVDIYDYFKKDAPLRRTDQVMKTHFGGSIPIQILVRGDLLEPGVLREIKRLQDSLDAMDDVHNPQSVADLIEEMSDVMGEGKVIPDSREKIANLWFLLEGEEVMEQLVNHDRTEALVQATMREVKTAQQLEETVATIDTLLASLRLPVQGAGQTGMVSIYNNLDVSILQSQYISLALALALIFFCLVLLVGSVVGGLVGMIPMAVTLVMVFGVMGYAGIPLDVATVLVGSISIGIGIDYTIHVISRYRSEYRVVGEKREALHRTLVSTGRAVVINVITVTLGFLVLLLANLVPLQRFGILGALTMVSAGLGALFLVPAVIMLVPSSFAGSLPASARDLYNRIRKGGATMRFFMLLVLLAACLSAPVAGQTLTAQQVLEQSDDVFNAPADQYWELKVVITDREGRQKTREAIMYQKGAEKRLTKFLSPADQRGIAFLSLPNDVQYLYLPAFSKTRRIASHVKNSKFAGTDFTYEDMEAKRDAEKWNATFQGEDDKQVILAMTLKPGKTSDYSRMVKWVRKDNYFPTRLELYDKGGILKKVLLRERIEKVDGFWTNREYEMRDVVENHSTRMILNTIRFNTGLRDDLFTERFLAQR